jgi:hypothetical protein
MIKRPLLGLPRLANLVIIHIYQKMELYSKEMHTFFSKVNESLITKSDSNHHFIYLIFTGSCTKKNEIHCINEYCCTISEERRLSFFFYSRSSGLFSHRIEVPAQHIQHFDSSIQWEIDGLWRIDLRTL